MNETNANKIKTIAQIHSILEAALEVNNLEMRDAENGKPTAFCDYSGHTNFLYVSLYRNGWSEGATVDRRYYIPLNEPISDELYNEVMGYLTDAMEVEK